jgi:hypothetical protein
MRTLMICTPSEIYEVDQIENDELGGPCSTHAHCHI